MKESSDPTVPALSSHDFPIENLNSLIEGCQVIGSDWRYLYINDAAVSQGRKAREQLLGRTMMEVYPGIENTHLFSVLKQCMADRQSRQMENEFIFPDGSKGWFELRIDPVPEGVVIFSLDITKRKHLSEEQRIMFEVLQLINEADDWESLLRSVVGCLRNWSGCEAVGIRIKDGEDFPYFEAAGFTEEFVQMENQLCAYNAEGEIERDSEGQPVMECMCGNILCGRFDPALSFFTDDGSFWSNCTTELLATTTDEDRQTRTRNRCNGEGYESVALIPLRSGKETLGLIQLNDRQKNRFTPQSIALLRRIADRIANFMAKKLAEARISHLNRVLRGIRSVNQLIVHEKDPDRLVQNVCQLLIEGRGFDSMAAAVTDESGKQVLVYAAAGRLRTVLQEMLQLGTIPQCAREAMQNNTPVLRRGREVCNPNCPCGAELGHDNDHVAVALQQETRIYGFIVAYLPKGMGEDQEEQELLQEVAGDIAFALHSKKLQDERDASAMALVAKEEQLRQVQKLESIGRLAGGVAHDFNNILAAQIGYCELIKRQLQTEDPLLDDLEKIMSCAERAAALTRQLLAFSRKQTLQTEVSDLNSVVAGIEKMIERLIGEDIRCSTALASNLGRVRVDPVQIEQVIMNLAVNARDAMPEGGTLLIETDNVDFDDDYVQQHVGTTAGAHVMLAITDSGVGMDEATKNRMFEPFFTTKTQGKGTGLGLATVYGIVKQSGGNIWVYSEPGQGTSFKIYLPRVEAELTRPQRREARLALGSGELVLIVEDEQVLRELFVRMFENLGYQVYVAATGDDALHAVETEDLRPGLLFTDVVLPGMSGKQLAERLVARQPGLKVLYTSGYTDNAIVHHGVLDPEIAFLEKPFNIVQLGAKVREVLCSG